MHINRTTFKKEIVCEYLLPDKKTHKVIILAPGAPGYPQQKKLMPFLVEKGFAVFLPRYRGSFESGGEYLKHEPTKDIIDIIDSLESGWHDAWDNTKHSITNPEVYLIGGSFGGSAVLLASNYKKVKKVIATAAVCDWRVDSEIEPMDKLLTFIRKGFGAGYKFSDANWKKLCSGRFYNPINKVKQMDGKKILMIHGTRDPVVPFHTAETFAKLSGAKLIPVRTKDHLGLSKLMRPNIWKQVEKFLR